MTGKSLLEREIDIVLLAIKMSEQAYHVRHCWHIIGQIQRARKLYPGIINENIGFFRTIFDSLVTSVIIGLGKLYDMDGNAYSLYSLQTLMGTVFHHSHSSTLKDYSEKLSKINKQIESLRKWRNARYAHNDQELGWDYLKLESQWVLLDSDFVALIDFACDYCSFFSKLFLQTPIQDKLPVNETLDNIIMKLRFISKNGKDKYDF